MKRRNFTRMIWICWCLIRYTFKINWTFLHCLTSSPFICVWVCGQIHAHESVSMYLNTSMVRPEENTKCLLSLHFGTISFTALPPRNKDFYWTRSWFLGVGHLLGGLWEFMLFHIHGWGCRNTDISVYICG